MRSPSEKVYLIILFLILIQVMEKETGSAGEQPFSDTLPNNPAACFFAFFRFIDAPTTIFGAF